MEPNYENWSLKELKDEYIKRKVYYRGEETNDVFIEKLKEDDYIHQERVNSLSILSLKDLKKMMKERDSHGDLRLNLLQNNLQMGTLTKDQCANYIIEQEDKIMRSQWFKEKREIEDREFKEHIDKRQVDNETRLEYLKKIIKMSKDIDGVWFPLFEKENKTMEEYERLVKLLILRLGTKKEVRRPIDYYDLPQKTLETIEEKFNKIMS